MYAFASINTSILKETHKTFRISLRVFICNPVQALWHIKTFSKLKSDTSLFFPPFLLSCANISIYVTVVLVLLFSFILGFHVCSQ